MNYKFLTFMSKILNIKWSVQYNDNEGNINNSNNSELITISFCET